MILGIDIGTTTIGWCVSQNKTELHSGTVDNPCKVDVCALHYIQDADVIYECVKNLIDRLITSYNIEKISFSTQMHGIVICDKAGQAISPFYTWQDKSGEKYTDQTSIPTGYGLATLYALIKEKSIPDKAYRISTIADYVLMRLVGTNEPIIHTSNAASFGLFDLENDNFEKEKCNKLGIDSSLLPKVVNHKTVIGEYDSIPCFVSIGDNQASVLACLGGTPGGVCLNFGTGSQISYISQTPVYSPTTENRPYINNLYLNCASALCGGRAYAILKSFFEKYDESKTESEIYEKLNYFALKGINSPLNIDTRFAGTRHNPKLTGKISNINTSNFTPANLCAGILYGMAYELYDYYKDMGKPEYTKIVASGGVVKKCEAFREILKRVFETDIEICSVKQEAAFGATLFLQD